MGGLRADGETPIRLAARVKLRSSATARNAGSTLSSSLTICEWYSQRLFDFSGYSLAKPPGRLKKVHRALSCGDCYRRTEQCRSAPWGKADWKYRRSDSVAWGSVSATALPPAGTKASRSHG